MYVPLHHMQLSKYHSKRTPKIITADNAEQLVSPDIVWHRLLWSWKKMFIFLSKSRGLQPWKKVAMRSGACSWATSSFNSARASKKHLSPTPNPRQSSRSRDIEVRFINVVIRACYKKINNSTFISILFFSCLQANIIELHLSTPCLKEKHTWQGCPWPHSRLVPLYPWAHPC